MTNSHTFLVVSDIHGALSGAKAIEEAFSYHHADKILCLGDVLYHGPRNNLPNDYAPKEDHPRTYAIINEDGFTVYTLDHKQYMHTDWL